MRYFNFIRSVGVFVTISLLLLLSFGCANFGLRKEQEAKKVLKTQQRQQTKDLKKMKKNHYQIQSPATQQMMKESKKRYRKSFQKRKKASFWDNIFGQK